MIWNLTFLISIGFKKSKKIVLFDNINWLINVFVKGKVTEHIKAVHLKIKNYQCHQCDKAFSYRTHLLTHIKAKHDKIKDFWCDYCDYTSSTEGNLKAHMEGVHDQVKRFKCRFCDYGSFHQVNNTVVYAYIGTGYNGTPLISANLPGTKTKWPFM